MFKPAERMIEESTFTQCVIHELVYFSPLGVPSNAKVSTDTIVQ